MSELQTPCVHMGASRCWPCMTDGCYDTPSLHPWWDSDDVQHAAATGQEPPSGWCGCAFCGEPAARREAGQAKADRLVTNSSRVALTYANRPDEHGRGRVVGYYDHPCFLIELDNGKRVAWSERLVQELRDADGGAS